MTQQNVHRLFACCERFTSNVRVLIIINKLILLIYLNCRSLSRRSKSARGMDEQKSNCEESESEPTGNDDHIVLGFDVN